MSLLLNFLLGLGSYRIWLCECHGVERNQRDQSEGGSLSLLNLAIRRRRKCSIIKKLLELHPEAVKYVSNANWTPLHEAIWHGASIETTKLLVESYPKALVTETITSQQTPLKLYWSHYSSNLSKEMIALLLKATSTVLFNEAASFPGMIHACLEYFKNQYFIPGLFEYLLDTYPEDTRCRWVSCITLSWIFITS